MILNGKLNGIVGFEHLDDFALFTGRGLNEWFISWFSCYAYGLQFVAFRLDDVTFSILL